jgi:hypothetical protein
MEAVNPDSQHMAQVWNEAGERVSAYLRACRVSNPDLRRQLVRRIVDAAARRHADEPGRSPVELAAEETRRQVEAWTMRFLRRPDNESPAHRFAHARAAVLLADLPRLWPDGFLNPEEQPAEFGRLFETTYLQAGPELDFANMAPRPIDFGPVSDLADHTWKTFDKWPILRGAVTWGLFLAVLGLAFFALRY